MEARYIAMWSGPRNISTAMMRSWENRPDTIVHDEPLYAHYLVHTKYQHPGAEEIIASYESDWRQVVKTLTGVIPDGKSIYYQKHMAHHLFDHMEIDWIQDLTNCFLIRKPQEMLMSLLKVFPTVHINQTGLPQQLKLFNYLRDLEKEIPPVIDARDVLENPCRILKMLCDSIGVQFIDAMLTWEASKRRSDGLWSKYWYKQVEQSTGFAPYQHRDYEVPDCYVNLLQECDELYNEMYQYRIH